MTQVEEAKQLMTRLIDRVNKLKDKNIIIQDNYDGLKETFLVLADAYKYYKNQASLNNGLANDELVDEITALREENLNLRKTLSELQNTIQELEAEVSDEPKITDKSEYYFRFGHTTRSVMDKVSAFIKALYNGIDDHSAPYELMSKEYAATKAGIDENTANIFFRRLCEMSIGNKPIFFITHTGKINSFYTPDTIIANISAVVKLSSVDSTLRVTN